MGQRCSCRQPTILEEGAPGQIRPISQVRQPPVTELPNPQPVWRPDIKDRLHMRGRFDDDFVQAMTRHDG